MQVAPVDFVSYELNSPYEIQDDSLIINEPSPTTNDEPTINAVNGIEPTATSVAINAISPESIQLQELQNDIVSNFEELKEGRISKEDFASALEEIGIVPNQENIEEEISNNSNNDENQDLRDLTSALIESVKGNSEEGSEIELSSYASIMDIVNKETQTPTVNEQLQVYTQNLRN